MPSHGTTSCHVETILSHMNKEASKLSNLLFISALRSGLCPLQTAHERRRMSRRRRCGIFFIKLFSLILRLTLILYWGNKSSYPRPSNVVKQQHRGEMVRAVDHGFLVAVERFKWGYNWRGVDYCWIGDAGLTGNATSGLGKGKHEINVKEEATKHGDGGHQVGVHAVSEDGEPMDFDETEMESGDINKFCNGPSVVSLNLVEETQRWLQVMYEQVVEGMRCLRIDTDESALTAAFANLRIDEDFYLGPASDPKSNPFLNGMNKEGVVL